MHISADSEPDTGHAWQGRSPLAICVPCSDWGALVFRLTWSRLPGTGAWIRTAQVAEESCGVDLTWSFPVAQLFQNEENQNTLGDKVLVPERWREGQSLT